MPQVTVYIREEDIDTWKSLDRKSEFIHKALIGEAEALTIKQPADFENSDVTPFAKQAPFKIVGVVTADKIKSNGLCRKHGTPLDSYGKCLQKGHA